MLDTIHFKEPPMEKEAYKELYDKLITRLILLQQEAKKNNVGVVVLFEGWKGAGKGSRISDLVYHLDARDTSVYVTKDFNEKEASKVLKDDFGATGFYPSMQQFWKALGPRGSITFYDRGWYSLAAQHLINYSTKKRSEKDIRAYAAESLEKFLPSIESFEKQLIADGYLVIKFFLHISEDSQRERLTKLYEDPATRWRVKKKDIKQLDSYKQTYRIYQQMLNQSNFGSSEWVLLDAEDKRRVNLAVVQTLVDVMEAKLFAPKSEEDKAAEQKALKNSGALENSALYRDERMRTKEENEAIYEQAAEEAKVSSSYAPVKSIFAQSENLPKLVDGVNHPVLPREEYKKQLKYEQERLNRLELQLYIHRIPLIIMYEGWDAAGKGGNIKRVAQALDARSYTIFPSPAPTKMELAHPHLWRYWTRLPKAGHVGIYDRSWYGRVLVERVEGFASPAQWSRAYDEINEFERDLVDWGAILLKFWVDVSPKVQLERFEAREKTEEKSWKITAEDWRNRDKYPQYRAAVDDMFRLTSTEHAPWIVLESDDKCYARVKALRIINEALENRLKDF